MPIRIYALAKELNLDSKVLVEICTRAGVKGKGSALASLTDEETVKVRAFMSAGKTGRSSAPAASEAEAAAPPVFRREDYIAPAGTATGKMRVLPPIRTAPLKKKLEATRPAAPVEEPPATVAEPVETKVEAPAAKVEEAPAPPEKPAVTPEPPMRRMGRPVLLSRRPAVLPSKPASKDREGGKPREREERERGPAIKLAPLPAAKRPLRMKPAEPAPQKPDIKLPADAIRASKAGSKPLSEHLRKHEQKRMAEAAKGSPRPGLAGKSPLSAEPAAPSRGARRGGRGAVATKDEEGNVTLGGREQRQLKRKKTATVRRRKPEDGEDDSGGSLRRRTHIRRTGTNTAAPRKENVTITLPCTVRSFSEAIGVPARTILGKLLELGTMSNIAATLDAELAELLAAELGVQVNFHREVKLEQQVLQSLEGEDDPEKLQPRPPIVTFLGHVDHGKTSLLDRIIGIDVAAHEKGGITQHIRAYRVEKDGKAIAFVDTPGHEAFTEMRARGANVTDIAVLVVAAEDGVMPQTEEAISHAKAADVPIVVALNKIDLPGANVERAYQQLAANELLPSEWGGETEVVKTSATTGEGIDNLIETLLTVAELHEYKADPDRPACGTCLESELHEGRGVVAKLLVRKGTLHNGDVIVCGSTFGRVKAMYDTLNPRLKHAEAGPSTPVNVTGLDAAPGAGDRFYVLQDISQARQLAEERASAARVRELGNVQPHVTLENLFERLGQESKVQTLNIILRADVRGSIEAIRKELSKLTHPEVQVKVLQATVGGVTEADVHLAHASDAVIIGFSVVPDEGARALAEKLGVQIRRYDIIYEVTDDLKAALEGMLKPEKQEKELGRALVQQVFHISRVGSVAGCRVLAGTVQRDSRVRIIRDSRVIGAYALETLKREKDDAREVREGYECGMKLAGFNDIKEGDILEAYKIEEIARTF
ncbi:MAG: translation initiation factor IF-2 [Planctomycetaceae bacterium]|nr:translation initiation factor IF-2 [Planctomycetaceae bacterium]